MNQTTAQDILANLHESTFAIDKTLAELKGSCPDEPLRICATLLGKVMSDMFDSVMVPIYAEHPDLAPEWYREGTPRGQPEVRSLTLTPVVRDALVEAFDAAYHRIQSQLVSVAGDPREIMLLRRGLHQVSTTLAHAQLTLLQANLEPTP